MFGIFADTPGARMSDYAIDTAARFGDIPFVEFTRDLVDGVFDSLVEAHVSQMEQYTSFVASLTANLSDYINNTKDGVTFDQISQFVLAYELPTVTDAQMTSILGALENPSSQPPVNTAQPAATDQWWGGLINALSPAVNSLVDKLPDPSEQPQLQAIAGYNAGVLSTVPSYKQIHDSIATLIASNKYAILQNMAKQGMMRLVVTEGEIETKITFSTWNTSENSYTTTSKDRVREATKTKLKKGAVDVFKKAKQNINRREVTVNTAKSYQRDTSGTKVDIFGRVLIRFKTDYAPLGG